MRKICIYHSSDLDGLCSGAIVKRALPEVELIGYDYGEVVPEIEDGSEVIMVDVSLPMDQMAELASRCSRFTFIDHHKSALEEWDARQWPGHVYKCGRVGVAACELAWYYFFTNEPMPETVRMLGEYDTWRNSDADRWRDVLEFQFGCRLSINSPNDFNVHFFDNPMSWVMGAMKEGATVLKYQEQVNAKQAKRAYERMFGDYRAICINAGGFNSDLFKSVYNQKHELMMCYQWDGVQRKFIVSLYTTHEHIDCSVIAKGFGGGGHKKAAGFALDWAEAAALILNV